MSCRDELGGCVGQTWAELQAVAIAIAAQQGIIGLVDPDRTLEVMLREGFIKECSKHPHHYISFLTGRRRKR